MKKIIAEHWSKILFTIIVCFGFFVFTFYLYPYLVTHLVHNFSGYNYEKDELGRGTFGDMYGALNTFLSGLAFLGLLITIGVQIYLHNEEKRIDEEKEDKKDRDKIVYLKHIILEGNKIALDYKEAAEKFKQDLKHEPSEIPNFKTSSSASQLSTITDKIDQEVYFNVYRTFFNNFEIINVFSNFDLIKKSCEDIIKDIENTQIYNYQRKQEFANLFNQFYNKIYTFNYKESNFQQSINLIFLSYENIDRSNLSEARNSFILPLIEVFRTPQIYNPIPEYEKFLEEAIKIKNNFGIIEKQNLELIDRLDNFIKNINGYYGETIEIIKSLSTFNKSI